MANGGKRPGAGRKPDSLSKKTLDRIKVNEAVAQRIMKVDDVVFDSQLAVA